VVTVANVDVHIDNFIDGAWQAQHSDTAHTVVDPASGAALADVPASSAADVDAAVAAATAAFPAWSQAAPAERATALLKLADALEANAEAFAALESRNVGKPVSVVPDEVTVAADNLRFFAGGARMLDGRAAGEYMTGYTSMIRRDPVGVVGSVSPWNYPLMMAIWKIGPAVAAGCPIVLKPSELTPLTTLKLAEIAAGILPDRVFNVVTGAGDVGANLVSHPGVDMVSLTGSVATGKSIAKAASDSLKRVHLELGGQGSGDRLRARWCRRTRGTGSPGSSTGPSAPARRWPPAVAGTTARAGSSSSARSSAPSSPSNASTATTTRSPWPTTSTTASPPACGRTTSAAR
jgi:acyl-CoA reductase-like NAD-dependent aldehyde dehydrogenase